MNIYHYINTFMKVILVTGGFDPLHSVHIEYFKEAKKLGDKLIVGVNTDAWLTRKKGRAFMPISERINIIQNLTIKLDSFFAEINYNLFCRKYKLK